MSQENVEIARRYYDAYSHGGLDRCMEYWSDDFYHRAAKGHLDDTGPTRGKAAMRAHIEDWIDTFDGFWIKAVEVIDAGEETVIAVEQFGGRAKLSGVPTDQTCANVLTIRNKKIARCVEYETRDEALQAAGLQRE